MLLLHPPVQSGRRERETATASGVQMTAQRIACQGRVTSGMCCRVWPIGQRWKPRDREKVHPQCLAARKSPSAQAVNFQSRTDGSQGTHIREKWLEILQRMESMSCK